MTASRSKYSAPLQMAGTKFGIDLAGLFEDAEGNVDMGGFAPEYTTQVTEKGRGNVMSYKAPKMPTTISEFSLKPEAPGTNINITLPGGPPAPPAPPAKPVDTRRSLGSIAAEYGQSGLFGAADYFEAQKLGYSNDEIRSYMEGNPNMVAPTNRAGQSGGLYEQVVRGNVNPQSVSPRAAQLATSAGQDPFYFGGEDYKNALAAGRSNADIKRYLDQNMGNIRGENLPGGGGVYDWAAGKATAPQQYGGPAPAPAPAPAYEINTSAGQSAEFFGGEDYKAAKSAGRSDEDIRSFLDKNISGLLRGGNLPGGGGVYDWVTGKAGVPQEYR